MKRIKAACLMQTIHFQLKEDMDHEAAVQAAQAEYIHYKAQMDRNRTRYEIVKEKVQPDGSLMVELKKQVNHYDCTPYFTRV